MSLYTIHPVKYTHESYYFFFKINYDFDFKLQ